MGLSRRSVFVGLATMAMVASATPAMAAEPVGTIRSAGGATAVADSYIVVFKDSRVSRGAVEQSVDRLLDRHGGQMARMYTAALRGAEVRVDASAAARIAADPAVAYVEQNHTVSIAGTQPNPPSWGLDRVDQRNLPLDSSYTYPNTASDVTAYIIDTGIRTTHTDFGGRATWGTNTADNNDTDCNGHGTHVAGTVGGSAYGIAKEAKLVAVKVLNCAGSGSYAGVIAGVDWVTANADKPAVANMSLGGGANSSVDNAVTNSINSGVTYALAAGNSNANACNYSPARTPAAITVGSTTSTDGRSWFSNYGTCLDLFAPGSSITAPWNDSDNGTNTISGTSMASPHAAGAAALVLSANPSYTPQQIRDALVDNATDNVVGGPGSGSPNKLLYIGDGGTPPPPPPPGCTGTNDTDVAIPDAGAAVTSSITITDCDGNASAASTVAVDIPHTWRGDLVIDLIAPDGSSYRLKTNNLSDSADNVNETYTVNLSSEVADGTWKLQVQDVYRADTGYINTWTLTV